MDIINDRLSGLGLFLPEILLPRAALDLEKWAVIACDQYTQDRGYWERVKDFIAKEPSTLNLIFPEVYLGEENQSQRINNIHETMNNYLNESVFAVPRTGCVFIERNTPYNTKRRGLVIAVDLERYDWKDNAGHLIRCTEGTVPERLPPRMDIRRNAALETSHILLLIDDVQDKLLAGLAKKAKQRQADYRSTLMQDSGDINGWFLDSIDDWKFIADELEVLYHKAGSRYENKGQDAEPFLFAAGDGNHSLATAKEIWEEYKKNYKANEHAAGKPTAGLSSENNTAQNPDSLPIHPCRYALAEIENLYDPAIKFEPIHRVIFDADPAEILSALAQAKDIRCIQESSRVIRIENLSPIIATAGIQPLLDKFTKEKGLETDYIHGKAEVLRIAENKERKAVGLILPPVKKEDLFKTVAKSGPLPRKSFSVGEACEKRFYLECRKLFG